MCTSASWSVKYLVLCSLRSSLTVCSNRAFSGPFSRFMCTFSSWSGVVRCVLFALSTNLRAPHLLHSPCDPVPSHPLPTSASIGCGGCAPSSVPFIIELHAHFLPTHDVLVLPFSLSFLHYPPVGSCCSCGSCRASLTVSPSSNSSHIILLSSLSPYSQCSPPRTMPRSSRISGRQPPWSFSWSRRSCRGLPR
jgi:hypothetical protein